MERNIPGCKRYLFRCRSIQPYQLSDCLVHSPILLMNASHYALSTPTLLPLQSEPSRGSALAKSVVMTLI